jgi:hypothetical protein
MFGSCLALVCEPRVVVRILTAPTPSAQPGRPTEEEARRVRESRRLASRCLHGLVSGYIECLAHLYRSEVHRARRPFSEGAYQARMIATHWAAFSGEKAVVVC